jgi:hypothetical protein
MALYIHADPISKEIHTENQTTSHSQLKFDTQIHIKFAPGQDTKYSY